MVSKFVGDWLIPKTRDFDSLPRWFDAFLIDRKSQSMATGTLDFYHWKLRLVDRFLYAQGITHLHELTPDLIRALMIDLERTHNAGGTHQVYRALRTFLRWYAREAEPPNWRDPMANLKPPRLTDTPLAPLPTPVLQKLLDVCGPDFYGVRDKAMLLFLFDTGIRANELTALDREDIDEVDGSVYIRNGKGNKSRMVVIGKQTRKAVRVYLRFRTDDAAALWITDDFTRISYRAVDNMLRRRAQVAKVPKPMLHSFRRAFALNCLRAGMDVFSLQRLMGHADLSVLKRYLALDDDDLRAAHAKASPVDNWR